MNCRPPKPLLFLAILLPALIAGSAGASWDVSGNLDLATRIFTEDPRWSGQDAIGSVRW